MSKKGGFQELLFTTIMPKIYGIGAAIVIVGAMFKISHWPGATAMLVIGLTTEAIIFFLSSFEPKHKEIDWAKVYPELADDYDGPMAAPRKVTSGGNTGVSASMDKMLADAKVGPELIRSLGMGMKSLSDSARKMAALGDAALVTNEYAKNVKATSGTLVEMNKSYAASLAGMKSMTAAARDTKEYHSQVQNVTKSLGALNAVYEMELKDAQGHVKSMNKFYSNLTQALESMGQAGKETTAFQAQLNQLTTNIASLNKVYGNMLSAMKQG